MADLEKDIIDWINSRVVRTSNGCLEFQGQRNKAGYGRMRLDGKKGHLVHRVVYVLTYGPLPPQTPFVLHRCDNPPCVEPTHLYAGTKSQNLKDAWERNPSNMGKKPYRIRLR